MQIYLLSYDTKMREAWEDVLGDSSLIIVCDTFQNFMDNYHVDCVVSPGNSFGIMNGGYDLAITNYFGTKLTRRVQKYIRSNCKEHAQEVGTSIILDTKKDGIKLIHTPTMVIPLPMKDTDIIRECTESTLKLAKDNDIKSIVLPAFGGGYGEVDAPVIAQKMEEGLKNVGLLGTKF